MGYTTQFGPTRKLPLDGSFWVRVREFSIPEEQALVEEELSAITKARETNRENMLPAYYVATLLERILKERVVGWNLTDDQDAPIPCTDETILATLSREHQEVILDTLMPRRLRFMRQITDGVIDRFTVREEDAAPTLPETNTLRRVDVPPPENADPETDAGF